MNLVEREYPFHEGARSSLKVVAVLCMMLVVATPLGIWLLLRATRARVRLSSTEVDVTGLGGTSFRFDEIDRLGVLEVKIVARGLGGALVKRRVGGDKAVHLVARLRDGKTRKFIVSSYENFPDIVAEVVARAGKRCETLTPAPLGVKWP